VPRRGDGRAARAVHRGARRLRRASRGVPGRAHREDRASARRAQRVQRDSCRVRRARHRGRVPNSSAEHIGTELGVSGERNSRERKRGVVGRALRPAGDFRFDLGLPRRPAADRRDARGGVPRATRRATRSSVCPKRARRTQEKSRPRSWRLRWRSF
jgi:hypothetical protein